MANIEYKITQADGVQFTTIPSWTTYQVTKNNELTLSINGQPNKSGSYHYNFSLVNGCGNVTGAGTITVLPSKGEILVITPNGDGSNDVLEMDIAKYYTNNELTLYNRKGTMVYQQQNYNNDFDGSGLIDDTYIYVFKYTDQNNKKQILSNTITILR